MNTLGRVWGEHSGLLLISAGLLTILALFSTDQSWSWRVFLALAAVFLLSIPLLSLLLLAGDWMGRDRLESNKLISRSRSGYGDDPNQPSWQVAEAELLEAIQVDPTNQEAYQSLHFFYDYTLRSAMRRYETTDLSDLPIKFRRLFVLSNDGFWTTTAADASEGSEGRATSKVHRLKQLWLDVVGSKTRPHWTVAVVVTGMFLFGVMAPEDVAGDDLLDRWYSNACEATIGECGMQIGEHTRADALLAFRTEIENKYLRATSSTRATSGVSCLEYLGHVPIVAAEYGVDPHFVVRLGYKELVDFDPEDGATFDFEEVSAWKIYPPRGEESGWALENLRGPQYLPDGYEC